MFINLAINLVHVIYNYTDAYDRYDRRHLKKKKIIIIYRDIRMTTSQIVNYYGSLKFTLYMCYFIYF